jgi:hypothetical protein
MLIEKIVSADDKEYFSKLLSSMDIPWYYNDYTFREDVKIDSGFQFTHTIYSKNQPMSPLYDIARKIMDNFQTRTGIKIKDIYRIKANLLTRTILENSVVANTWHQDIYDGVDDKGFNFGNRKYTSLVYYVIDSDGDTVIKDDDEYKYFSPIAGNLTYFDSRLKHRSTNPLINKRRIVINFVLETE